MRIDNKVISFFSPGLAYKREKNLRFAEMFEKRSFEGAKKGRRLDNWITGNTAFNDEIVKDIKVLLSRSRDLSINNPYGKRVPFIIANNSIGTGIIASITSVGNNTKKIEELKQYWNNWTKKVKCDHDEVLNLYGLQHLAMMTTVISGGCIVIRKSVSTDVNPIGLQIQILEPDFLDMSVSKDSTPGGGYIHYGVEYDKAGKKKGFYIFDRNPTMQGAKSNFIPATDVIHLYQIFRPGQNRGVPNSSSTMLTQRDLDEYEDAELVGKKTQACLTAFVTNSDPTKEGETTGDLIESLEPGAINYLNPGESITFNSPQQSPGYTDYTRSKLRAIAAGNMVSYEAMTGDLSNVNFSSGRMGWIEFQRMVEQWQWNMFIPTFCEKVFDWFIDRMKIMGVVKDANEVTVTWTAPRREMIDPAKEVNALVLQMQAGLLSWEDVVKSLGNIPEEVIEQIKRNLKQFKDIDFPATWNPANAQQLSVKDNEAKKPSE